MVYNDDVAGRVRRRPWHSGLVAIGATLLIGALITDTAYWQTLLFQWNNISGWLIVAGLVFAGLAGLAFLVDLIARRLAGVAWWRLLGLTVAALLSVLNAFVHSRDAYTAVVPQGIILSAVVTALLVFIGLSGGWNVDAGRRAGRANRVARVEEVRI